VAAFLIRHGHAGTRGAFAGPDPERPLSDRGRAQAAGIADLLAARAVGMLLTSPAARCRQTLQPLADKLGLAVVSCPDLAEGADAAVVVELLLRHAADHVVLCTHGDVIPGAMRLLATEHGVRVKGKGANQKGSIWEIDVADGRLTHARYEPPAA
jgi:phosphohistidine phosphatase SixA